MQENFIIYNEEYILIKDILQKLKINTSAQVIGLSGEIIPGLYAAGMVSGGFIGPYYPGSGTAVTATVVLGRIAGSLAAQEPEKS